MRTGALSAPVKRAGLRRTDRSESALLYWLSAQKLERPSGRRPETLQKPEDGGAVCAWGHPEALHPLPSPPVLARPTATAAGRRAAGFHAHRRKDRWCKSPPAEYEPQSKDAHVVVSTSVRPSRPTGVHSLHRPPARRPTTVTGLDSTWWRKARTPCTSLPIAQAQRDDRTNQVFGPPPPPPPPPCV